MDKKYQVFISSTYKDLIEVRREVARSVLGLTEIPAAMEDFGAIDQDSLSYIKSVIDSCDYYILIIAGRYGATDFSGVSYTEQEYDYAVDAKKTVLAFIRKDISKIPVEDVDTDPKIQKKLRIFRDKAAKGRLVKFWDNPQELQSAVVIALSNAFKSAPGIGWIRADSVDRSQTVEIKRLEFENQTLKNEVADLRAKILEDQIEDEGLYEIYRIKLDWTSNRTRITKYISLSWIELFKIFAPLVRRYVKIRNVRERFSVILISAIRPEMAGAELAEISEDTYEEIEYFFMGRDVIEIRNESYFYMTRRGLILLSSLKNQQNNLPTN